MVSMRTLLHPAKLNILVAFTGNQELSTADLSARLPDIPTPSLYRYLAELVKEGVLELSREVKIRGVFQKYYRVNLAETRVSPEVAKTASKDDISKLFLLFSTTLIAEFDNYLSDDSHDLSTDHVGFTRASFYATDAEMIELNLLLKKAITKLMEKKPEPGSRRYTLAPILIPSPSPEANTKDSQTSGAPESE